MQKFGKKVFFEARKKNPKKRLPLREAAKNGILLIRPATKAPLELSGHRHFFKKIVK